MVKYSIEYGYRRTPAYSLTAHQFIGAVFAVDVFLVGGNGVLVFE